MTIVQIFCQKLLLTVDNYMKIVKKLRLFIGSRIFLKNVTIYYKFIKKIIVVVYFNLL